MYLCISVLLLSYGSKRTWLTKLCSSWKPDMCSSKHFLSCVSLLLRHTGSDLDFKISLIYTVYTVDLWSIHAEELTFLLEFNLAAFVSYLTISSLLCEFSKKTSSNRKKSGHIWAWITDVLINSSSWPVNRQTDSMKRKSFEKPFEPRANPDNQLQWSHSHA